MINLVNLNRQHTRIKNEVELLENEIKKGVNLMNPGELALHINFLAGQLKIHLLEEDEFLYPDLLKSEDGDVKNMANSYISEMGNLMEEYTEFKKKYNIGLKISADKEKFLEEIQKILEALKARIMKEDHGLYALIQKRSL